MAKLLGQVRKNMNFIDNDEENDIVNIEKVTDPNEEQTDNYYDYYYGKNNFNGNGKDNFDIKLGDFNKNNNINNNNNDKGSSINKNNNNYNNNYNHNTHGKVNDNNDDVDDYNNNNIYVRNYKKKYSDETSLIEMEKKVLSNNNNNINNYINSYKNSNNDNKYYNNDINNFNNNNNNINNKYDLNNINYKNNQPLFYETTSKQTNNLNQNVNNLNIIKAINSNSNFNGHYKNDYKNNNYDNNDFINKQYKNNKETKDNTKDNSKDNSKDKLNTQNKPNRLTKDGICPLCNKSLKNEKIETFCCKVVYCYECVKNYVKSQNKVVQNRVIRCPNSNCIKNLEMIFIHTILEDKAPINKQDVVICPVQDCCSFYLINEEKNNLAKCRANHKFCTICFSEELKFKKVKENTIVDNNNDKNDSLPSPYINKFCINNTKECPSCFVLIKKTKFNNFTTCCNCKYEFCWICEQKISPTHYNLFFSPCFFLHNEVENMDLLNSRARRILRSVLYSVLIMFLLTLSLIFLSFVSLMLLSYFINQKVIDGKIIFIRNEKYVNLFKYFIYCFYAITGFALIMFGMLLSALCIALFPLILSIAGVYFYNYDYEVINEMRKNGDGNQHTTF